MPPCQSEKRRAETPAKDAATVVVKAPGQPVYVRCDSLEPFINPTVSERTRQKTAAEINKSLNLDLGQKLLRPENKALIKVIHFLNKFLVSWWEHILFKVWNKVPVSVRRKITYMAWKLYLPIHKLFLGRSTGIHPDASPEYHALTTAMWGGRFFPVTIDRMRFSLGQLTAAHPTPLQSSAVEDIDELCETTGPIPDIQKDHCRVEGVYLHHRPNKTSSNTPPTEYTVFWLYGGAFLAGDAAGNMGPADYIGSNCGMDVFIPTYRLAPESDINDLLWDVALAYRWLYLLKQKRNQDPAKIVLFGCSSGAALCTRLMQFFAELERGEELLPNYIAPLLSDIKMPAAGVLASPYVDYRPQNPDGSFLQYSRHDLIVNQPVLEVGLPFLDTHMCGRRVEHGPLNRSLAGLPPLCVLVSEHETVYDETCLLVNKARAAGTQVTVGMWKYMCHVWCFLGGFIPEGKQSMDFACEWIREQQEKNC